MSRNRLIPFCFLACIVCFAAAGQVNAQEFSRADKLRGSITPEREWWDLKHYHLALEVSPETKSLKGQNVIRFEALKAGQKMQIDLQEPLKITRVMRGANEVKIQREGNVYWLHFAKPFAKGAQSEIKIEYGGVPTVSKRPPWSGGLSWNKDEKATTLLRRLARGLARAFGGRARITVTTNRTKG